MPRLPRQVTERLQAQDMRSHGITTADVAPVKVHKPYEYLCEGGHSQASPYELTHCQLAYCGKPLRRIGAGSRKAS